MKSIVQLGYPTLTKKAKKIEDFTNPKVQELIDELLETVQNAGEHAAGLAANQIGELASVTVVLRMDIMNKPDFEGDDVWEVIANPDITKESEAQSTYWEGCLSVNNGDLFGEVTRPRRVTVEFQDRNGKKQKIKADGYFSHLLQHEIDHLNGILFTSYVTDPSKLYTGKELDEMRSESNK